MKDIFAKQNLDHRNISLFRRLYKVQGYIFMFIPSFYKGKKAAVTFFMFNWRTKSFQKGFVLNEKGFL